MYILPEATAALAGSVKEQLCLCLIMQGMLTEDAAKRSSGHVQYVRASAAHRSVCGQQLPLQTCSTPGSLYVHLHLNTANWKLNSHFFSSEQEKHAPLA